MRAKKIVFKCGHTSYNREHFLVLYGVTEFWSAKRARVISDSNQRIVFEFLA